MRIFMPSDVKKIIDKLNNNGFEAYIVGGCVRDSLMGKIPSDWDIATSATPYEAKKFFKKTFDTGIEHGTVTVVLNKKNYELTTYRIDGEYADNRRPLSVEFSTDLTEDLSRRDFTINAIAYNETDGLKDPFDGISDIKNKVVKCVGDANLRFKEDGLRMLRALRFSAQLGFEIDNETYSAILHNARLIKNISVERIRDEFRKILMSERPEYVALLDETGLSGSLNMRFSFEKSLKILKFTKKHLPIRLALLFVEMSEINLTKALKFLSFENSVIKAASIIAKWTKIHIENNYYEIRKAIKDIGAEDFLCVIEAKKLLDDDNIHVYDEVLDKLQVILENNDCTSLKQLKINGNKLKELGVTDGREIGSILESLLDKVLKNPKLNTEAKLNELAKSCLQ